MTNQLAIVFPGQGSQAVGMLADIANQFPEVQQTFAEASEVLGYDLWAVVKEGPAEKLNQTMVTQPALLAASYALWRILSAKTAIKPALLAGHSLGEYTALVCANALKFTDAIKLVAARGQYMQEAVPSGVGAMAAIIGLDDATVADICKAAQQSPDEVISPANYNSMGQVVIAGHKAPVERAIVIAKEKKAALAMLIPVSVPSHCQLMKPAAERLAALLQSITLQPLEIPVINNVEAARYTDAESIRKGLTLQLYRPVRWVETIQAMIKSGINTIIECGPGKVLTGLNKRIDKNLQLITTSDAASLESLLKSELVRSV